MSSLSIASSTASVHTSLSTSLSTTSSASSSGLSSARSSGLSSARSSGLSSTSTSLSTFTTVTSSSAPSSAAVTSTPTTTDNPSATAVINPGNARYQYYGCYNETTALNQTGGRRAFYGGSMEGIDTMTVAACLAFCGMDGYAYAGLEYTTECWCNNYISVFSAHLPDSQCNLPCKGNTSEICGGSLKLSVYQMNTTSKAPRSTNTPTKLFIVGLAIAGLVLEML